MHKLFRNQCKSSCVYWNKRTHCKLILLRSVCLFHTKHKDKLFRLSRALNLKQLRKAIRQEVGEGRGQPSTLNVHSLISSLSPASVTFTQSQQDHIIQPPPPSRDNTSPNPSPLHGHGHVQPPPKRSAHQQPQPACHNHVHITLSQQKRHDHVHVKPQQQRHDHAHVQPLPALCQDHVHVSQQPSHTQQLHSHERDYMTSTTIIQLYYNYTCLRAGSAIRAP